MGNPSSLLSLPGGLQWIIASQQDNRSQEWFTAWKTVLRLRPNYSTVPPNMFFSWHEPPSYPMNELTVDINFSRDEQLIRKEYGQYDIHLWQPETEHSIRYRAVESDSGEIAPFYSAMRNALFPIYQFCTMQKGLPLHAALIAKNGKGIILAGTGSTGKSTSCRRLQSPWHALADDEILVMPCKSDGFQSHPFPTWTDIWFRGLLHSSWPIEASVPLSAICFLIQSHTDALYKMPPSEAAYLLYQSSTDVYRKLWGKMNSEVRRLLRNRLLENSIKLADKIPVYFLHNYLYGRYWDLLENEFAI